MIHNARKNHVSPGIYSIEGRSSSRYRFLHNIVKKVKETDRLSKLQHHSQGGGDGEDEHQDTVREFDVSLTVMIRLPWDTSVGCQFVIEDDAYYYGKYYGSGMNGMNSYNYQTKKSLSVNFPITKHVTTNDRIMIKSSDLYDRSSGYGIKPSIEDTVGYGNANDYTIIVNGVEHPKTNILVFPIEEENYTVVIQYKDGHDTF